MPSSIADDINKGLALIKEGVALIAPHGQTDTLEADDKPDASTSSMKEVILWVFTQKPQSLTITARGIYGFLELVYPSHVFRLGTISSALCELHKEGKVKQVRLGKGSTPSLYQAI